MSCGGVSEMPDPDYGLSLTSPSLGPLLGGLLCAGVLGFWRYWQWRRQRSLEASNAPFHLRLSSRMELSPQHTLYVVETAGRYLLLGGAPGGLSLLTEVARPADVPEQVPASEAAH